MLLRVSLLNVQGLVTKRTNKLQTVEFQNIFPSSDVVLLTETWTNQYSDIEVNNFEAYVLNRKEIKQNSKRNSGGLILYIRNTYVSNDTLVYTSIDDIIWVKIDKFLLSLSSDLYIALCYVTPDDSIRQSMLETNVLIGF